MPSQKHRPPPAPVAFDLHAFLDSAGVSRPIRRFSRGARVFAQGGPADCVFYLQKGSVKLSILAPTGANHDVVFAEG